MDAPRIDRRTTIKWMLAASAALRVAPGLAFGGAQAAQPRARASAGYGTDPDLMRLYEPGDVWPLSMGTAERQTAAALCDLIIPADADSPSASEVGVVAFLDEWISAPYPVQQTDRRTVLSGLQWLDEEAQRRFRNSFAALDAEEMSAICDEVCYLPRAPERLKAAAEFFARFRDLAAGGYYTSPEGMRAIRYVGNVALPRFDGPPPEVLRRVGLSDATDAGPP
ncbi:MAG TPA: gluconate 2-dehydrogenase subunit 3 family protein [Steroidobacteraceae bacterium]|nr:gluconate 2-dehydrogenase subunit 3 family protein [Steroidobacteraceae bacterium]